jgi:hypothetical protein
VALLSDEPLAPEADVPAEEGMQALATAGPIAAILPFDLAALDAALESFLDCFKDASRTVLDRIGGLGPAPWLAVLAAGLIVYEAARRRNRNEQLASKLAAVLPESPP